MQKKNYCLWIITCVIGLVISGIIASIDFTPFIDETIDMMANENNEVSITNPFLFIAVILADVPAFFIFILCFIFYIAVVKAIVSIYKILFGKKDYGNKKLFAKTVSLNVTGIATCPQCGGTYDEENDKCPYCGYISPERSRIKDLNEQEIKNSRKKEIAANFAVSITRFIRENGILLKSVRIIIILIIIIAFVMALMKQVNL